MKISKKATTIAIVNQKGGTGKTTTCENLGIGLAMEGKKVLLVDADPQGSLTISMGWQQPDELPTTLSTLMAKAMNDQCIPPGEGVLHHAEGVDLIPANIELAGMEVALVNTMSREKMLKQVLDSARQEYDYILLDCTPSLGMLTINALAATDTALIPVQAQYLSAKGLEQLLQTINKVHRQINPKLKIEGILLTMTDNRTNYGRQIDTLIRQAYSCLKTLANKHRSRISKVRYEYRDGTGAWGVPYETKKGKRRMMFAKYSDCKGKDLTEKVPDLAYRYSHNTTSFEERLKAKVCEVCGCTDSDSYEIHHVNKVKNLKGKADWEKVMLAKRRKTIVVCHKCHMRIHHGTKTE